MRAHRAATLAIAVIATVVVATGCGSGDGGGSSGQGSGASSGGSGGSVAVTESEFKIDPANPTVSKTGEVTFTVANTGRYPHALEVEGNGAEARTPTIEPGKTATLKVDLKKDGTYDWYCPVDGHRQKGMEGKVTVGSGGGSGGSSSGKYGGSY
jgi:uncharacterized cupredoxin-like copper-binding protein